MEAGRSGRTHAHRVVVETADGATAELLVAEASRLGACTVERLRDGTASVAVEFDETDGAGQTSRLSRILEAVERWLRQQPVPAVTVWVDGRRFALERRGAQARPAAADEHVSRGRQTAARTASS